MAKTLLVKLSELGWRGQGKFSISNSDIHPGYFDVRIGELVYFCNELDEDNLLNAYLELSIELRTKEKLNG